MPSQEEELVLRTFLRVCAAVDNVDDIKELKRNVCLINSSQDVRDPDHRYNPYHHPPRGTAGSTTNRKKNGVGRPPPGKVSSPPPSSLVGSRVKCRFVVNGAGEEWFKGTVTCGCQKGKGKAEGGWYNVRFDDGEEHVIDMRETNCGVVWRRERENK